MRVTKPLVSALLAQALVAGCYLVNKQEGGAELAELPAAANAAGAPLIGTAWESPAFGPGCRHSLALLSAGTYRLAVTCPSSDQTSSVTEAAYGRYSAAGGQLALARPQASTCPGAPAVQAFFKATLDYQLTAPHALALFHGTTQVQEFVATTPRPAGPTGCLGAGAGAYLAESTD